MNPLHIASITGRAHNIRTILTANPGMVSTRDKTSMTPIAYACRYGHVEAVKTLIEFKAKLNVGCGQDRLTPLGWAATYGHYELTEYLLSIKARVLGKDKFQRTPLIMAVRNGHTKIASLLLQNGSEWDHHDSSMNTALHYAAAYGWMDCINLLLKLGSDVNAQNSWKISPINIAMLKNHIGCVKRFLEEPNVDVNGKDDKGRTLLMLSLLILDDESYDFIAYLLSKGADPNIADLEGQASLHYIAKYNLRGTDEQGKQSRIVYKRQVEIQKKIAQLLIQNKAELSLKDKNEQTAFSVCLEKDNAPLLEFLKDKVSINNEPQLFFAFKEKIFNVEYQQILESLIKNDPPTKETINTLDANGLTPFLAYIQSFTKNHDGLLTTLANRVNQQSFIHGTNKRMYKLTNEDVFDKFADQSNYYNYNPSFTQEDKMAMAKEFMDGIIVKPFINILKFLIAQGAEVNAQVAKLKKYRDLEEKRRQELLQLAAGE
jgi:ankyrin repeat protein